MSQPSGSLREMEGISAVCLACGESLGDFEIGGIVRSVNKGHPCKVGKYLFVEARDYA